MINAKQCKMARAATGLSVRELAKSAGVAVDTISRIEAGEQLQPRTAQAIQSALEAAGITFINAGDVAQGQGVTLRS